MSQTVKLVIKTPPDPKTLGTVHSTYQSTTLYSSSINTDASSRQGANQATAVAITFVRNNRVFGPYCDAIQARLALDFLISRENEFGLDH